MTITKLGHCCLLVETKGIRILTDPGNYSDAQNNQKDIDFILISHEHTDHLHVDSLRIVLKNNPTAKIITNAAVGKILEKETIPCEIIGHAKATKMNEVLLVGWGTKHEPIYKTVENVENTGFIIDDRFFYPGDAFTLLERENGKEIEILALPVAGPWMKISEAVDYALKVRPKKCFPVHDGNLKTFGVSHRLPKNELTKAGIEFLALENGQSVTY